MFLKQYKFDGFLANILKLLSGNVAAQAIALITVPFITRLFSPEDYGMFSLYSTIIVLFAEFSSLSYVLAIILPQDDRDACNIVGLCFLIIPAISIILYLVVFFFKQNIGNFLNCPQIVPYLWLLPLSVCLKGIYTSLKYWSLRKKNISSLAISRVAESLFDKVSALTAGLLGYVSAIILIGSHLLGSITSVFFLIYSNGKIDFRYFKSSISTEKIKYNAKRYKKFPLISTWSNLINSSSRNMPIFIMAIFFSPEAVGLYALCNSILAIPIKLFGDAVFNVFFQKISERKNQREKITGIAVELLDYLVMISIIPTLCVCIFGKEIFSFIFGSSWEASGSYAQILSATYFFTFCSRPFWTFFHVYEKQEIRLVFSFILLPLRITALIAGGFLNNIFLAITLYSIVSSISFLGLTIWLLRFVGVPYAKLFISFKRLSVVLLPFLIFLISIKSVWKGHEIICSMVLLILIMLYYSIIVYRDNRIKKIFSYKNN